MLIGASERDFTEGSMEFAPIMPTYEYQCEKCGLEFEQFQSMKDDALTTCPKDICQKKQWGKGKVHRATDYRSESYKAGAKNDKPSPAKETKSKSSSKPKKSKSKSSS
jgi:putative FmdB family regulatory protein